MTTIKLTKAIAGAIVSNDDTKSPLSEIVKVVIEAQIEMLNSIIKSETPIADSISLRSALASKYNKL